MSIAKRSVAPSLSPPRAAALAHAGWYARWKRGIDVLLASAGLLASLPVWVILALAIVLDSGLPVFYSREVGGKDGKSFRLYKLRTMKAGNTLRADLDPAQDPRLTRVGRLLRRTALDELPALWHILKGQMSFVGPRTLLLRVEDPADPDCGRLTSTLPRAVIRSLVRPGLTGLAQLYAPKNLPYRHKFRYDALYARKMSLGLDIKLIFLSFLRTFLGRWEQIRPKR
ncbi:MAG: sugar transferase [Chloroflexi bacterium]|nr:sugar transferase [Chloroflexota bacterium]